MPQGRGLLSLEIFFCFTMVLPPYRVRIFVRDQWRSFSLLAYNNTYLRRRSVPSPGLHQPASFLLKNICRQAIFYLLFSVYYWATENIQKQGKGKKDD